MQGLLELPETLRERAIRADETSSAGIRLAAIWAELRAGRLGLVDQFQTQARDILLFQRDPGPTGDGLDADTLETFESVLLGDAQKKVAVVANVATSTVALRCKAALRHLNVGGSGSRVPLSLVVLVHAHRGQGLLVGRCSVMGSAHTEILVVSFTRPELRLEHMMSASEYEVACLCTEGCTHEEMALRRGTSRRTVANQLASVFRKLGVSGRSEFLARIARGCAPPRDAPSGPELLLLEV
jgi:DNA-binding CsgD family transcriptional regulator